MLQVKSMLGYIYFSIEGENLVHFLQTCQSEGIVLWEVTVHKENKLEAKIYLAKFNQMKMIAEHLHLKLTILERKGMSNFFFHAWKQKEKLIALFCSVCLLFYLSHTIWNVQINGVASHLEYAISEQLDELGIYKGSFQTSRLAVEKIETKIMERLPQLLYISVKKRGTIYTIEALEKQEENQKEESAASDLIALKSGTIQKMFIKEGQASVAVNDFVRKGDLLVSGKIDVNDSDEIEEDLAAENKKQAKLVRSEGDVFANTWYEIDLTSRLEAKYESLKGEKIHHYFISFGKLNIPLFIWPKAKYNETKITYDEIPLHLFKKELPISLQKRTTYAKQTVIIKQSKEKAKEKGIDHALKDLQNKLGKETEILKYYILHEAVDSGKVKLRLYVSVLENIAEQRPIKEAIE